VAWDVEAQYHVPYLAHATMEPMSAVADVTPGGCTLYSGAQSQTAAQAAIAKALGIPAETVTIHTTYAGGGFGRRWLMDFPAHAAQLSKRCGRPVKLLYSREADMDGDYYRPACAARFKAALDDAGKLAALDLKVSGQSILESGQPGRLKGRPDPTSVSGLKDQPYACGSISVSWAPITADVPVGVWRSVGHSQNGFFLESFIDEVARSAGADPMDFRRAHLAAHPRLVAVMEALALNCCWSEPKGQTTGRGLAIGEAYGSFIAQVVDIDVLEDKRLKLKRISCAFDCGTAINPAGVKSQIEGSILFALSAALWGETKITNGRVQNDNFHSYEMLTLAQTPPIDVTLLEHADAPLGGAGESGVPPLAPALANAIADATGERIRTLPLAASGWSLA
jgi:isoquinoline 1-oxidoreductase beta subunit